MEERKEKKRLQAEVAKLEREIARMKKEIESDGIEINPSLAEDK